VLCINGEVRFLLWVKKEGGAFKMKEQDTSAEIITADETAEGVCKPVIPCDTMPHVYEADIENEKTASIYPPPYSVIDGCLFVESVTKSGTITKRLCNFTPRLVSEITHDDGAVVSKRLRLGGEHANGYPLHEIEISGGELSNFNWLLDNWGADCNIDVGGNVKENIRYAIQSTAKSATHETVYSVTGWKKIGGEWYFLMPDSDSLTVELGGKLKRYSLKNNYSANEILAAAIILEVPFAPKEIVFPLLSFVFLSPLNEFLCQAGVEPKTVLMLTGKTGAKKSTLAALMLSFFGNFTASDLPLSFHDTANSIIHHTFALKDVLTCIDDFHPCGKLEEGKLTATVQSIMRAYGDRTGRGRLKADSSPIESRPPHEESKHNRRCFGMQVTYGNYKNSVTPS
jgi:hypothetical protein